MTYDEAATALGDELWSEFRSLSYQPAGTSEPWMGAWLIMTSRAGRPYSLIDGLSAALHDVRHVSSTVQRG